jgi:hypothetical protein
MSQPIIAYVDFVDGITRPVFAAPDGRQYVMDDDEPVFGLWVRPTEEPAAATTPEPVR